MADLLTRGKEVRIVKEGRELRFSIAGRKGIPSTGIYREPGQSGNLPSGEAYIAPVEGTAEGKLWVDGSMVGIGLLREPLEITISAGKLNRAEGIHAKDFLTSLGASELARNVAEFGIGTNRKARLTGIILEDEKIYGTVHVAFGDNSTFGGSVQAGIHLDGVILKPDVYVDDAQIMDEGEIIIP
jgi:leucyl aminopeptidase (aminopeptidase T)